MIDDVVYYDLYDLGFSFGYKRWDGKSYNTNGEKIELPYKSKINQLAIDAEVDLLFYNNIHPMVSEYQINNLIFTSKTKKCREYQKEVIEELIGTGRCDLSEIINVYYKKGDR
jgi:hypothetical protein